MNVYFVQTKHTLFLSTLSCTIYVPSILEIKSLFFIEHVIYYYLLCTYLQGSNIFFLLIIVFLKTIFSRMFYEGVRIIVVKCFSITQDILMGEKIVWTPVVHASGYKGIIKIVNNNDPRMRFFSSLTLSRSSASDKCFSSHSRGAVDDRNHQRRIQKKIIVLSINYLAKTIFSQIRSNKF